MTYSFGPYRLMPEQRSLVREGKACDIGSRCLDILALLLERAGQVVSKDEIVARAWPSSFVEESSVRVQIAALRKALDDKDRELYIRNVPGRGYCFVGSVSLDPAQAEAQHELEQVASRPRLPPPLIRMIGRDQIVTEIVSDILVKRFVSIVASGGVGKTTVALAAANELESHFAEHVYFTDLSSITQADDLLVNLAVLLGVPTNVPGLRTSLIRNLEARNLLLVLDNCEHLVEDVALFAEAIYEAAPRVHLLVTSREALRASGETILHLPPLEAPPLDMPIAAAQIGNFPAVQLFFEKARASGLRVDPTDDDATKAAQVCQRLDGIPLALELAAARAGSHGLEGVIQLLGNRFRLQWRGRRAALPRHQTLRSMFDWSYNLLSHQEQALFRALSVFSGGFTPEAAAAVASAVGVGEEESYELCEALAEKSLVGVRSQEQLYRLTETARAYAFDSLQGYPEERDEVYVAHAKYSLKLARDIGYGSTLFGRWGEKRNLSDLLANVRPALKWTLGEARQIQIGVDLIEASWPIFYELGLLEECSSFATAALEQRQFATVSPSGEASLHEAIALAGTLAVSSLARTKAAYARCLELARTSEDHRREARTLAAYNVFISRIGEHRLGLEASKQFETVAGILKHREATLVSEWMNGTTHAYLGEFGIARSFLERSVPRFPVLNLAFTATLHLARARALFARTLWITGEVERAKREAELAVEEAQQYDHPISLSVVLGHCAGVHIWGGDLNRAAELSRELKTVARSSGLAAFEAIATGLLGELALRTGDLTGAEPLLHEAMAGIDAQMHANTATSIGSAHAEWLLERGRPREALDVVDKAIARAEQTGELFQLSNIHRLRSTILLQADPPMAVASFRNAIEVAERQGASSFALKTALAYRESGIAGTEREADAAVLAATKRLASLDPVESRFSKTTR